MPPEPPGWRAVGSLGDAGMVGMLGASVSSLTHCGLGSFGVLLALVGVLLALVGVLLALVGVSTATIAWFARLEPVLIPAGYALMLGAILQRVAWLKRSALAPAVLCAAGCGGASAELPTFSYLYQLTETGLQRR